MQLGLYLHLLRGAWRVVSEDSRNHCSFEPFLQVVPMSVAFLLPDRFLLKTLIASVFSQRIDGLVSISFGGVSRIWFSLTKASELLTLGPL